MLQFSHGVTRAKTIGHPTEVWPKGAQEAAVRALREIEEDFIIGPATRHELDVAHQEALRGEGVSLDDIKERLACSGIHVRIYSETTINRRDEAYR